jgi:cytochrome c oxidase subunit 2
MGVRAGKPFGVVLAVIAVISAATFFTHGLWLPPDIAVHGPAIDRQLRETMIATGVLFVAAQLAIATFAWRADGASGGAIRTFPGGATSLVVGAIVLVGIEIAVLTLVGSKVWAAVYLTRDEPGALTVDVQAEQFAFFFRYPGPDGKFGAIHPELMNEASENYFGLDPANDIRARDDIVAASLAIPVGRPIVLWLHSKDVNHAFYVPELRIQQDFVPGLDIPLRFTADTTGKFEIVCTQLCGLGHYNMRAFLEVMQPAQFDQWLKDHATQ